jgi:hypothetical protein
VVCRLLLLDTVQLLMEGVEPMIFLDVPYVPPQETPMIVAAAADAVGKQPVDYLIRSCTETEHDLKPDNALRGVHPAAAVMGYMQRLQKKFLDIAEFKPTLLQGPQQGSLEYIVGNDGSMFYAYDPKPGFLGKDKAVFMVEYRRMHFKVSIDIHVLEIVSAHESTCPSRPTVIKLRKSSRGSGSDLSPGELSSGVHVADLDNAVLAQTHGWYIDYTSYLNGEESTGGRPRFLQFPNQREPAVFNTRRLFAGSLA